MNPHLISKEKASENLLSFINNINPKGTRGTIDLPAIKEILPIYGRTSSTRSGGKDCSENNPLLYLMNFDNGEGYALVAADDRITSNVIAVTESGAISADNLQTYLGVIEYGIPNYPDYPSTGPGMYCDPDWDYEYFINPNTFNFIDPETDDQLIGNLLVPGSSMSNMRWGAEDNVKCFTLALCMEYAKKNPLFTDKNASAFPNKYDGGDGAGTGGSYTLEFLRSEEEIIDSVSI